jgi:hypothetical protein
LTRRIYEKSNITLFIITISKCFACRCKTYDNPIATLSDDAANIVVAVQQVEATEQATTEEKQEVVVDASAEVAPAPEFEVTIQNAGVTTTHMVQGQWGCAMQCNNEMVMVTMMANQ